MGRTQGIATVRRHGQEVPGVEALIVFEPPAIFRAILVDQVSDVIATPSRCRP